MVKTFFGGGTRACGAGGGWAVCLFVDHHAFAVRVVEALDPAHSGFLFEMTCWIRLGFGCSRLLEVFECAGCFGVLKACRYWRISLVEALRALDARRSLEV